ncbi:unnamed protein product [Peniophora sp. CBMAI 1063]|nr:unnamed protein product [Peniophora sp. CBMAI 1063]
MAQMCYNLTGKLCAIAHFRRTVHGGRRPVSRVGTRASWEDSRSAGRRHLGGDSITTITHVNVNVSNGIFQDAVSPSEGAVSPPTVVASNIVVNVRDIYNTGGLGALLFGFPKGYSGEDEMHVLKCQLPTNLNVGERLSSNMGIQDAAPLAEPGLGLGPSVSQRGLYDTTDGIDAFLFSAGEGYGSDEDEDVYILKRDDSEVEARSPDLYAYPSWSSWSADIRCRGWRLQRWG